MATVKSGEKKSEKKEAPKSEKAPAAERAKPVPPSFEMVAVDALPEEPKRGPRSTKFDGIIANLATITESPGQWFRIAYYHTSGGAGSAYKAIEAGKVALPDGFEFDIEPRKVANPDGEGRSHSALFAMCLTGAETPDAE